MSAKDFETYYKNELHGALKKFDKRKRRRHWLLLMSIFSLAALLFMPYFLFEVLNFEREAWLLTLLPFITLIIIGFAKRKKLKTQLRDDYKVQIISKIVKFIDPSLAFYYNERIANKEFIQSGIYAQKPDRISGEDLVSGTVGKTNIIFSELHAQYKTTSKEGVRWHTIFRGVFLVADFHKHFNSETYVLPDRWERWLGNFARKLQSMGSRGRRQLAEMENQAFEKAFRVYTRDQIEARYILSPSLMERMLNFKEKAGRPVAFSFVNSKMFAAVSLQKNLFEPRWFLANARYNYIAESFAYLRLFTDIVEDLKLNTRIWSKQ